MRILPVFSLLIMTGYTTILSAQIPKKNQHILDEQLYQNCTFKYEEDKLNNIQRYDSLALSCKEKGQYKKAKKYLEKVLDIRVEIFGRKHQDVALSYNNLGEICRMLSDYEKAKFYHKKALKIRLKIFGENSVQVAQSYNNLALICGAMSDYETAKKYHEKALDIRLNNLGENHIDVANSYGSLAVIYHSTSDYEQAEKYGKKALRIMLDNLGENHLHVAFCYNNLASTYQKTGDYEKAREYIEKSLKIRQEKLGENHICLASIYNNLAVLCHTLGNYESAKTYQEQALNIELNYLNTPHVDIATSCNNLGEIYKSLGYYDDAEKYHKQALEIRLKILGNKHIQVAQSYDNLAVVYKESGSHEIAKNYHRKSLNIRQGKLGKHHLQVAQSYNNLAEVYYTLNDVETAKKYVEKSLSIRLEKLNSNHIDVITCYSSLAILYEEMERYSMADSLWNMIIPTSLQQLKNTCLFLPEKQRLGYLNTITPIYNHFYLFASNHGTDRTRQLVMDLLLNTKSLALTYSIDTKKTIETINNDTLNDRLKKLITINNELGRTELMTPKELEGHERDLSKKIKNRDSLAYLILKNPELRKRLDTKIIKWQDIQDCLNEDEAVVDFMRVYAKQDSLWSYHAIIIKTSANPIFIPLSDEETLKKYLKHNSNGTPVYLSNYHSSYQLYEKIWQPMESHLKSIKKVSISPVGLLHLIAFESLKHDKTSGYLMKRLEFHHYSALRDILKEKTNVSFENIVLGGHIVYDSEKKEKYPQAEDEIFTRENKRSGFQRLQGTLEEVVNISKIAQASGLTHTLLTSSTVTEDTVQHFSGDFAPSILHWATHGDVLPAFEKAPDYAKLTGTRDRLRASDNPLQRSILAFFNANHRWEKDERTIYSDSEDGILTALEVTALDLQNTDLVVLSACSTGLGDMHNTEGVFGLQRAFKLAGVEYVVASLWDVDDGATKELMVKFYKNLLQKKQDPATALRTAKDELREAGYEPENWAGFILIE